MEKDSSVNHNSDDTSETTSARLTIVLAAIYSGLEDMVIPLSILGAAILPELELWIMRRSLRKKDKIPGKM